MCWYSNVTDNEAFILNSLEKNKQLKYNLIGNVQFFIITPFFSNSFYFHFMETLKDPLCRNNIFEDSLCIIVDPIDVAAIVKLQDVSK
jgi:hypothetical protein